MTCQRCGGEVRGTRPICQSCVSKLKAQDYAWCCSEKHKGNRALPLTGFRRAANGRKDLECKKCATRYCPCGTPVEGRKKWCAACKKIVKHNSDTVARRRWRERNGLAPAGSIRGHYVKRDGRRVFTEDEIADKDYSPRGEAEKETAVRWLLRPEVPREWFK